MAALVSGFLSGVFSVHLSFYICAVYVSNDGDLSFYGRLCINGVLSAPTNWRNSRQIVEMLGGAIGVDSTPGKGSTFAFYVTTQRARRPEFKASNSSLVPASIGVSLDAVLFDTNTSFLEENDSGNMVNDEKSTTSLKCPLAATEDYLKILVVEDNFVNQKVLCKQLRKRDFIVTAANHGREALEALKQTVIWKGGGVERKFDVVLMDLEMPVMGGMECVRNIRQAEKEGTISCYIPVIAVTANARSMHAEAAIQAGMDGMTTKPYRIADLVAEIEVVCRSTTGRRASII
jgi:CheY-like chemotaxis protein